MSETPIFISFPPSGVWSFDVTVVKHQETILRIKYLPLWRRCSWRFSSNKESKISFCFWNSAICSSFSSDSFLAFGENTALVFSWERVDSNFRKHCMWEVDLPDAERLYLGYLPFHPILELGNYDLWEGLFFTVTNSILLL